VLGYLKLNRRKVSMPNLIGYCLVRTDLPSLGAGKAIAHAMHAGNQMTWREVVMPLSKGEEPNADIMAWHNSAGGFGTTIALGDKNQLDITTITAVVDAAKKLGFVADLVVDPTYPYLVDKEIVQFMDASVHTMPPVYGPPGKMVCFRKEVTTAYVFGDKAELAILLARFGLYPND
jgi:hypothetical protein